MAISAESLTELIAEAQKAHDDAQDELQEIMKKAAKLTLQRDSIAAERDAFISSLQRRFPEVAVPAPVKTEHSNTSTLPTSDLADNDWSAETRSEVVERAVGILTERDGFASPGSIEEYLNGKNRSDSRDNIGAALAYLNRTDKIQSLGRAKWAPREA